MKSTLIHWSFAALLSILCCSCGLVVASHHRTEDYTPVVAAVEGDDLSTVKAAVEKDPSLVKYKEWEDATLLHDAVHQNHLDIAEYLIKKGADVNARKKDGVTPLHIAAQNGNVSIIKLLLDHGARVNAVDSKGWTPLDRATKWQHPDAVDTLKLHGGHAGGQ